MSVPRRFDDALMSPPDAHGIVEPALLAALRDWCEGGGHPPLTEPLRAASTAPHQGLDGAACVLDGSHELARLGRWRGLIWRAQILLRERVEARGAQPDIPWDCGWWREGTLEAAAAFRPRRATLLMVRPTDPAVAQVLLSTLGAHSSAFLKPVRVLVVSVEGMVGIPRLERRCAEGLGARPLRFSSPS